MKGFIKYIIYIFSYKRITRELLSLKAKKDYFEKKSEMFIKILDRYEDGLSYYSEHSWLCTTNPHNGTELQGTNKFVEDKGNHAKQILSGAILIENSNEYQTEFPLDKESHLDIANRIFLKNSVYGLYGDSRKEK